MISTDPWIWLSALLSLSCFSLLYGDNKFFRWAETTYTASVVGHSVVTGVLTLRDRLYPLYTGEKLLLIIPAILGVLSLFVVWRKYAWMASISMAVLVGVGTGISIRTLMGTDIIGNTRAVIGEAVTIVSADATMGTKLGYLIRVIFTITAFVYFLFTIFPKKGPSVPAFNLIRDIGKYALIIYMGISLGNSMQQFVGTATSAVYRLTGLWLGLG
jgi:hypothetical protein